MAALCRRGWDVGWGADARGGLRRDAAGGHRGERVPGRSAGAPGPRRGRRARGSIRRATAPAGLRADLGTLSAAAAAELEVSSACWTRQRLAGSDGRTASSKSVPAWRPRSAGGRADAGGQPGEHRLRRVVPGGRRVRRAVGPRGPAAAEADRRGYFKHQLVVDILARPGRQDLTADVDFAALDLHGRREGFETVLFTTLAAFLSGGGAGASELGACSPAADGRRGRRPRVRPAGDSAPQPSGRARPRRGFQGDGAGARVAARESRALVAL